MKYPLISVVIPVYNTEDFLENCMDSLYVQTYKNLEIVVVDDGSKREFAELCDKAALMDSRVTVYHKENGGLSDARNYGIRMAKGEYITLIDSDDNVDPDYVEYLYDLIAKNDVRMSICQLRDVFPNRTIDHGSNRRDKVLSAKECIERMLYHDTIDTTACAKLYHRSLFANIEYPKGRMFEDIATTYKLFNESQTIAVGYESKYNYLIREGSIVTSSFSQSKMDLLDMSDIMAEDVVSIYPDLKDAVERRQVYARFSTLNQMLFSNDAEKEKKEIIRFIKSKKSSVMKNKKAPARDKIAILSLCMGLPFYKIAWLAYLRWKTRSHSLRPIGYDN